MGTSRCSIAIITWLALSGCATSQFQEREVLRVGPLRSLVVQPASFEAAVVLDVGTEAMTDDEVAAAATTVGQAFAEGEAGKAPAPVVGGNAALAGCRLRVALQRDGTHYLTRCRVRLLVDGQTLAAVEVEGVRTVPSRAVSIAELQARQGAGEPRDPRIDAGEATQALIDTALRARHRLLVGMVDGDHPDRPSRGWRAQVARTKLMTAKTATSRAAALVDLGAAGDPTDAPLAMAALRDRSALVRTAARHAVGELCDGHTFADAAPWVDERGQQRLRSCALLQGLPAPDLVPLQDPVGSDDNDHDNDRNDEGPAPPPSMEQGPPRPPRQILGADDSDS